MILERLLILVFMALASWLALRYAIAPIIAKVIVVLSRVVIAKVDKVEALARVNAANDELDTTRYQIGLAIAEQETIDQLTVVHQRRDK